MSDKSAEALQEMVLQGTAASAGIAIGRASIYERGELFVSTGTIDRSEADREVEKFTRALEHVAADLEKLTGYAALQTDRDTSSIIEAHKEIIRDPELSSKIRKLINEQLMPADRAVYEAFDSYMTLLQSTGNTLFKARLADLRDLRDRTVRSISRQKMVAGFRNDSILIAEDFTPTEIVTFSRHRIRGLVASKGGMTTHASIIAQSMGIPMVIGVPSLFAEVSDQESLIVNGSSGELILRPTKKTSRHYRDLMSEREQRWQNILRVLDDPSETACGQSISLRANVEFQEEFHNLATYRTDGVGLLRTESFFMEEGEVQLDVTEQEAFYEQALQHSPDHSVTIRLFDVGGDKVLNRQLSEDNPFLGWRGVRVLLGRKDLLRKQLEALVRVSGRHPGRIRIMIPMVCTIEEVREVRQEMQGIIEQLEDEQIPVDPTIPLGIMIEVPSAAILAYQMAREVDFFSIGTNDLTQYTLAVDRGNSLISYLFQQMHPAVLRLIHLTSDAARQQGIGFSICGELASNPFAAGVLVGLGCRDLSMSPVSVPYVKSVLCQMRVTELQQLADKVLDAETVDEISEIRMEWQKQYQGINGL